MIFLLPTHPKQLTVGQPKEVIRVRSFPRVPLDAYPDRARSIIHLHVCVSLEEISQMRSET